ncbi:transcription initiation at TATA-containing promoter protein [Microbotryomycetes sp. JL221]|nr:transcription initiation at TATA-containing promoter protein [Microbotryomycetes sp. JL221]
MSGSEFVAPREPHDQTQQTSTVTKPDMATAAQQPVLSTLNSTQVPTTLERLDSATPQPPSAPTSDVRGEPEPVAAPTVASSTTDTNAPGAPVVASASPSSAVDGDAAPVIAHASSQVAIEDDSMAATTPIPTATTPTVPEAAATLTQIATSAPLEEPAINGLTHAESQVNGIAATDAPTPQAASTTEALAAAAAPPATNIEAPVVPPAPIAAPETVPPPPVVPLPQQVTQRPTLNHVDSSSSLAAQPPTPTVPGATPAASTAASSSATATAATTAPAAASTSVESAPTSGAASPALAATETTSAPAAPTSTATVAAAGDEVKMEDATNAGTQDGQVSPTTLLKRSAPEELSSAIDQSLGAGNDERDVKRARVEEESASPFAEAASAQQPQTSAADASASASPAVTGFDPLAFSAPQSLPPSAYTTSAAEVSAPTMSPSDLHNPSSNAATTSLSAPTALPTSTAPTDISPAPQSSAPSTPIAVMTRDQQKSAVNLLRNLKRNRNAGPFLRPVDPVAQLIPDYPRVITKPMDLGTVETKVNATGKAMTAAQKVGRVFGLDYSNGQGSWEGQSDKVYRTADELKSDLAQIWQNCFTYNGPAERHPVSKMAQEMKEACEKNLTAMPAAPVVDPTAPPPPPVVAETKPRDRRPSQSFVPTIRRSEDGARPKREIKTPAYDLSYQQEIEGLPTAGKSRTGRVSGKSAQEQLRFCKEVVKELFKKIHEPYAFPFYEPVNYIALNIPQYPTVIKKPMDLGTIRQKLDQGMYPLPPYAPFEADVRLMFRNCYTFNPPGSPVNDMGHRLEAVFESKWEERPMSSGFEDEYSDDDGISAMQAQLANLQASIEMMKQNKRLEKERRRAQEQSAALMAAQQMYQPRPPKQPKRTSMDYGAPMPRASHPSGGVGHGGGARRPKKPKKKRDSSEDEDFYDDAGGDYYGAVVPAQPEEQRELVTFDMKRELATKIVTFEGENLERAIEIIRQGMPALLGDANKEIELDIDQLDQRTLLTLYRFVCPDSAAARPKPSKSGSRGRNGSQPGPSKRKNLDEVKESERIEMLEARLREFEKQSSTNVGTPDQQQQPQMGGAGIAGTAGAEQASSDSSSDDDSGSDSDDD